MCRPLLVLVAAGWGLMAAADVRGDGGRLALTTGWGLQSSAQAREPGDVLSRPGFAAAGWYAVTVPNTVVGALVENGTYPDPYFGMNLRQIPGTTYPIGQRFTLLPMPANSPFKPSWWYRKEFDLPATMSGRTVWLHFDGINYRADIWVNGTRIAGSDEVVGAFRRYQFDVSALLHPGARNAVAVEVSAPEPGDLAFMWVDWNPTPADKNMGLWGDVYLSSSGKVALRHPHVLTALDLPSLDMAHLTVSADLWNAGDAPVRGLLRGTIEAIQFSQPFELRPRERKTVRVTPAQVPQLDVPHPRVWWPYRMGAPNLYTLALEVEVDGVVSDRQETSFGIHVMSSELTAEGHRLFKVNGKPLLIRGAGWASDMLFRPASRARLEAELRYVKEMGLNTIRLEGKLESDLFYDLADRHGILLMPGWCCCDQWELWDKWDAEDHRVAPASLSDQILRLRGHPSVLAWFNGSDFHPPAEVEKAYLEIEHRLDFRKPVLSSATDQVSQTSGASGVKMRGPYDYVPPSYWLTDTRNGGAYGFATEISPGAAVPPLESLKAMLPPEHLWPIDEYWNFHAGGDEFKDVTRFTRSLEARYGKATGPSDYARKAQAFTYDNQRAMFEGYARNKYRSTGVIQWMLNNAWPSLIWHLYDYYLRPGGGYYGTKKACEPVHVQFSYDDRSVAVVNDTQQALRGLSVSAQILDLGLAPKYSEQARLDLPPDSVVRTLTLPVPKDVGTTYFVRLRLHDGAGQLLSSNFYWLSTREDVLDWKKTEWFYTPTKVHADLTALARLPATSLSLTARFDESGAAEGVAHVRVENTGQALAFQVHLKLVERTSRNEPLPVFWDDNYFELFPGEARELRVAYPRGSAPVPLALEAQAWNAPLVTDPAR